jgi:hypothetical protein
LEYAWYYTTGQLIYQSHGKKEDGHGLGSPSPSFGMRFTGSSPSRYAGTRCITAPSKRDFHKGPPYLKSCLILQFSFCYFVCSSFYVFPRKEACFQLNPWSKCNRGGPNTIQNSSSLFTLDWNENRWGRESDFARLGESSTGEICVANSQKKPRYSARTDPSMVKILFCPLASTHFFVVFSLDFDSSFFSERSVIVFSLEIFFPFLKTLLFWNSPSAISHNSVYSGWRCFLNIGEINSFFYLLTLIIETWLWIEFDSTLFFSTPLKSILFWLNFHSDQSVAYTCL